LIHWLGASEMDLQVILGSFDIWPGNHREDCGSEVWKTHLFVPNQRPDHKSNTPRLGHLAFGQLQGGLWLRSLKNSTLFWFCPKAWHQIQHSTTTTDHQMIVWSGQGLCGIMSWAQFGSAETISSTRQTTLSHEMHTHNWTPNYRIGRSY
jgi:hypothetical protein